MKQRLKGIYSEQKAICWLIENNYHVFVSIDDNPIDLIAYKDREFKLIDVKSVSIGKSGNIFSSKLSSKQIDLGVIRLLVSDDSIWFDDGKSTKIYPTKESLNV